MTPLFRRTSNRLAPSAGRLSATVALCVLPAVVWAGTPRSSSDLRDSEGERHTAAMAFDGLLGTGWAEGAPGDGEGEWLELRFNRPTDIESVSIWPGDLRKGQRSARESGRPHTVTVTLTIPRADDVTAEARVLDPGNRGPLRVDVPIVGKASAVRISLDQVYPGGIYNNTFITEVAVNFAGGGVPKAVDRLTAWLESDSGQRAIAKNREEVIALFDKIQAEEFGDRDALGELMDRAGDGAPFMRRQAMSQVTAGYRVQALPPDETAVEALLKLKDSNAIPAMERAALRSRGRAATSLRDKVEVFQAYAEIVGGGNRNIPPWGQSGWEEGALRGHGEPLDIVLDQFGGVYVADVANNRVQRYNVHGIVEQAWGAEGDITNRWFYKTRKYYAAGSAPGEEPGQFVNPVDLALIPGKIGDSVAVLDAVGRISIIGETGKVDTVFKLDVGDPISPGANGEGHIVLHKDRLVVIWGNEGFVRGLDGEELGDFKLDAGVPSGAIMWKGKLALIYGKQLVLYSLDGFRHGDVIGDTLGEGYESWAITKDENGKLWAVTDQGLVVKYKKPGRVDYSVFVSEYSLTVPRIAAYDDIVFVTDDDRIIRADALELKAQAELDAEDAAQ